VLCNGAMLESRIAGNSGWVSAVAKITRGAPWAYGSKRCRAPTYPQTCQGPAACCALVVLLVNFLPVSPFFATRLHSFQNDTRVPDSNCDSLPSIIHPSTLLPPFHSFTA
jgi:hypothetical protein